MKYKHCDCKVLKKNGFKYDSNPKKKVVENKQSDVQNITTEHPNIDQCSSCPSPKRKKFENKTYHTDNNKECYYSFENKVLYDIPEDKLENFYKYQFYNISIQENKTEWDTITIFPEYSAIINIEVKRGSNDSSDKLKFQTEKNKFTKRCFKANQTTLFFYAETFWWYAPQRLGFC